MACAHLVLIGEKYVVTEWDDAENVVQVLGVVKDDGIVIQYHDGLTHTVSAAYLLVELKARLVH